MPTATVEHQQDGRVIIVSGPGGCGKTEIINALRHAAKARGKTTDTIFSTDRNEREASQIEVALAHSTVVFVERLTR